MKNQNRKPKNWGWQRVKKKINILEMLVYSSKTKKNVLKMLEFGFQKFPQKFLHWLKELNRKNCLNTALYHLLFIGLHIWLYFSVCVICIIKCNCKNNDNVFKQVSSTNLLQTYMHPISKFETFCRRKKHWLANI